MNFFNSVAADLVEKRLWPVAAVLGAGAVAAPVVAHLAAAPDGSPPSTAPALRGGARPPTSPGVQSLIDQLRPDAGVIPLRQGGLHDPFAAPASPAAAPGSSVAPSSSSSSHTAVPATSGPKPPTAGPGSSAGSGAKPGPLVKVAPHRLHTVGPSASPPPVLSPSKPGPADSQPTTGKPAPGSATPSSGAPGSPHDQNSPSGSGSPVPLVHSPAQPQARSRARGHRHGSLRVYRVGLRFGQAASAQTITNPTRLSPLPSSTDPAVVFLGVMKGGKTAAFLIPKTAVATGDGSCRPSPARCEVVELKVGESEFLDIRKPQAGLVQYELDVTGIVAHKSSSRAEAARAHHEESKQGRALLRGANSAGLARLNFSPRLGFVYVRPSSERAGAGRGKGTTRIADPAPAPPPDAPAPPPPPTPGVSTAPSAEPAPPPAPRGQS